MNFAPWVQPARFAPVARNPGTPLTLDWFEDVQVNLSAAERRAATLPARRSVKKNYQAAWLVKAHPLHRPDHACRATTRRAASTASAPRRGARCATISSTALGLAEQLPTVGAVCVYPTMVPPAVKALEGSGIPVASVATGFPAGLTPLPQRLAEIRYAVDEGAGEIDIVIHRAQVLTAGLGGALRRDRRHARGLRCGAHEGHPRHGRPARRCATSTRPRWWPCRPAPTSSRPRPARRTSTPRCPSASSWSARCAITASSPAIKIGFKPAGGLKTAKDALNWLILMKEELGRRWLEPDLFRIGASSMLGDIERQLEHHVTGRYAAATRHAARLRIDPCPASPRSSTPWTTVRPRKRTAMCSTG